MMMLIKESGKNPDFSSDSLGIIINMLKDGKVSRDSAKKIFSEVFYNNISPEDFAREHNLEILNDASLIGETVRRIIKENEKAVNEYKSGKDKSFNFLVGQCMRALKGRANAADIKEILLKELN